MLMSPCQFKEVTKTAQDWIRDNEPDTLAFEVYEESGKEGDETKISMVER